MLTRYQGVFRSRWKALWWALGVCTTAYCTVSSPDGQPDAVTRGAIAAAGQALPAGATRELTPQEEAALQDVEGLSAGPADATPTPAATGHVNPWALPHKG